MPPAKQNDIVGRMRHNGPGSAQEEIAFSSAFFEMFLNEFLTGTSGTLTVEPQVGRHTPDFQVDGLNQLSQDYQYIVEAADVDSLRGTELEEQWNEAVALDALDEIESPDFYLHVETSGRLRSTPPKRALQWPFRQLAQNNPYAKVRGAQLTSGHIRGTPSATFQHEDWSITGWLTAVDPGRRPKLGRFVGSGPFKGGTFGSSAKIKNSLDEKAGKYGSIPDLIIAVNCDWWAEDEDIERALFGSIMHAMTRGTDGFWRLDRPAQHANVVGVMAVTNLYLHAVGEAEVAFYPNPHITNKTPDWTLRSTQGQKAGAFAKDHVTWTKVQMDERDAGARQ